MRILRELILEQTQKLFSSKNDSILFYWITIDRFSIILQTRISYILSNLEESNLSLLFLFLSKGKKKRNKTIPRYSSKTSSKIERQKIRMRFVGRSSRYLDGQIWLPPDRCPERHFRFLVSRFFLDIFDLPKRRIERRISNGREQCI